MNSNKAIAGGLVGLTSGMTGGITPLIKWVCISFGVPEEVCDPFSTWLGAALTTLVSGAIVYYIPNKPNA